MKSHFFLITYLAANVGLIAYGILALVQPGILLEPFNTHVYQFPVEAEIPITYLSGLYRLIGYLNIIPGVLGLLILHRYWVTRLGRYLKMVIAITILTYLGPIVFDNTVGTIGFFEIFEHILFGMILISGLMMLIIEGRQNMETGLQTNSKEIALQQTNGFEANLEQRGWQM
jgi:hypothetical protein